MLRKKLYIFCFDSSMFAVQATNGKPGTPRAGAKPAAAQPKQADTGKASQAKAAAPKTTTASAAAPQKQEVAPQLAVLAAADLDEPVKAEPAPKPKPKPSVRDALYNPKKVSISLSCHDVARKEWIHLGCE